MQGIRTPFREEVFKSADPKSRKVLVDLLRSQGYDAKSNEDKYGIDVSVNMYEVEHRDMWVGSKFPYSTIHVPARKADSCFKYKCQYVVFNKDWTYCLVCPSETIMKYPPKEIPNTREPEGEYFFDVPRDEWQLYKTLEA